jgi:lipoprotein-releasing system permease protein
MKNCFHAVRHAPHDHGQREHPTSYSSILGRLLFLTSMAWRYVWRRSGDGFISALTAFSSLGIALGVATLLIVMSVMHGYRDELLRLMRGQSGDVTLRAVAGPMARLDPEAVRATQLALQSGAMQVVPVVERQALVLFRGSASGAVVRGLDPEVLTDQALKFQSVVGSTEAKSIQADLGGQVHVWLGRALAEQLGVVPGVRLRMVHAAGQHTPFGQLPKMQDAVVSAVVETGLYWTDQTQLWMASKAAQDFFGLGDRITHWEVSWPPDQQRDAQEKKDGLARLLGDGWRVTSWLDQQTPFLEALEVESVVMFLILTLMIVVATFNIVTGLVMLVKDKQMAIAILRTMGMQRSEVMTVFAIIGMMLGGSGALMGLALGTALIVNLETIRQWLESWTGLSIFDPVIYYLSRLPAVLHSEDLMSIGGMTLVLSVAAALYPAWRAASVDPAMAVRHG